MTTKEDYIKRVLLIMDEAGLSDIAGNSLLGADTTQADRIIEGSFVDAWRRCVKVMPRTWFQNKTFKSAVNHPNVSAGTGYVELPADFYLLCEFRMIGWRKSVYEASLENERTSSIQSNEYTRGSEIRPVCTISNKSVGDAIKQVLHYYSVQPGKTHEIEEALYVPVVKSLKEYSLNEDLGISDQIAEPLAYLSASTVFTIFGKYDISQALQQRAVEMFPGLQSVRGNNITIKQ
jgi:hypothetical protein